MVQRQKDPLRPLTAEERAQLAHVSRSRTEPAAHVAHAQALLAVAAGQRFTEAARAAGRRSGDAVAQLVARFNRAGLAALEPSHGGGQPKRYTPAEQERILREVRRAPARDEDGTATWSLATLQGTLRRAPDGVSQRLRDHVIPCRSSAGRAASLRDRAPSAPARAPGRSRHAG